MSDLTRKKAEAVFAGAMMNIFPGGSKQPTPAPVLNSKVSKSSSVIENDPEDIPKEDLLHLCMKLNKRMQSMETKGQELNKRKVVLLNERRQLLDAIKLRVAIPVYPEDDQELDATLIVELMNKSDEHQRALMVSLEKKITDLDQLRLHETLASDAKHRREILDLQIALSAAVSSSSFTTATTPSSVFESITGESKESVPHLSTELVRADSQVLMLNANEMLMKEKDEMQATLIVLTSKIKKLESQIEEGKLMQTSFNERTAAFEENLRVKNEDLSNSRKENEDLRAQTEEKIMYLQMQLNSIRGKDEQSASELGTLRGDLEVMTATVIEKGIALDQKKDMVGKLQNKLFENEEEIQILREKIKELERNVTATKLLKDEKESLLLAARRDMKGMVDSREQSLKKIQELEEYKLRTENISIKLADMDNQITILQSGIDEKNTLITRLRAESVAVERNMTLKTSLIATGEAMVVSLKKEIEDFRNEIIQRDILLKLSTEKLSCVDLRLESVQAELEKLLVNSESEKTAYTLREANSKKLLEDSMADLISKNNERIEAIKKENLKKSSLARTLLTEREEENNFLRTKNEELVTEIKSGAPSERRIFELAEVQAKREAVHGLHGNNREIAFQQLQITLEQKDFELAKLQQNQSNLMAEISELRRHTKREGVNLDYLKNVVLQYMTFPLQSPEKASLVPVLAMLLQFNAKEMEQVLKDPLWGNRPVKEVKRALNKATVVLPPRMEIGITFGERKESRDKEPLLGVAGFKAPLDSLEFEDEDIR